MKWNSDNSNAKDTLLAEKKCDKANVPNHPAPAYLRFRHKMVRGRAASFGSDPKALR